jgi:hypothetical protein
VAESGPAEAFLARVLAKTRLFPSLDEDEIVKDRFIHGFLPRYSSHLLASDMEALRRLPRDALQQELKRRIRVLTLPLLLLKGKTHSPDCQVCRLTP